MRLRTDDAPSLLTRGYGFAPRIWRRVRPGARSAPIRLLGDPGILVRGEEGVALFTDASRVRRRGSMPAVVQETLFGHESVHALDGEAHLHRKAAFVDIAYRDAQVARLLPLLEREWRAELEDWLAGGRSTAYDAAVGAFGRATMRWAGLPGTPAARTRWSRRLAQIVDGFGAPYEPGFVGAVLGRAWSDRHAARLIEAVRSGALEARDGTALHTWAWHRDRSGALLPSRLAGIELQNVLRPMIAAARFVAYAAKALHEHPEWRERIAAETAARGSLVEGPLAIAFAQEVRRTSPFVPVLPGIAVADAELDGHRVAAGDRVVLDLLGTSTDARSWDDAEAFDPERFVGVDDYEALRAFVPHGGGDVATGHRCPGEKLAIAGVAAATAALSDPRIEVLGAGLAVDLRRLPTKPASGGRVRAVGGGGSGCPFHR